ncbi:MAG: amidohydrolase family protein [Myxococcales bacterium]|nr:amidohydrolase family protein [Myxococcales bacterium]
MRRFFSLRDAAFLTLTLSLACTGDGPTLVRPPDSAPAALLIENAAVLDVATGELVPARDVLLRGDRIDAVGPARTLSVPAEAGRIDARGATLLPGLVDMHGHVFADPAPPWQLNIPNPEAVLRSYLYSGVTTVLDPADASGDAFTRRDRIRGGDLLGPRVYATGPPLTAPGGHPVALVKIAAPAWISWYLASQAGFQIDSPEAGRAAVDTLASEGANFIKVIVDRVPSDVPRLGPTEVRAIVETARARGLRVVAHIGSSEDALLSGRAGVAAWVHGVYTERIPERDIAELASFGIPMVATLEVFDSYARMPSGLRAPTRLERESAPAEVLSAFEEIPEDSTLLDNFGEWLAMVERNREHARENLRRLRAAGVTILAGSDTQSGVFPGPGLHRELALLEEVGMSPAEVIRAATLDSARFLSDSEEPDFGRVVPGARADLLLVSGDPRQDLAALSRIREVIVGGVRLHREPLQAPGGDRE